MVTFLLSLALLSHANDFVGLPDIVSFGRYVSVGSSDAVCGEANVHVDHPTVTVASSVFPTTRISVTPDFSLDLRREVRTFDSNHGAYEHVTVDAVVRDQLAIFNQQSRFDPCPPRPKTCEIFRRRWVFTAHSIDLQHVDAQGHAFNCHWQN